MIRYILKISLYAIVALAVTVPKGMSAESSSKKTRKIQDNLQRSENGMLDDRYEQARQKFIKGEISLAQMWEDLTKLHEDKTRLTRETYLKVLQTEAFLLEKAGYPILASIYAAQAIDFSQKPFDESLKRAWSILWNTSQQTTIQNILTIMAEKIKSHDGTPPYFERNWNYIVGYSYLKERDYKKALQHFEEVKFTDEYYPLSLFHASMAHVEVGHNDDAIKKLRALVHIYENKMLKRNDELLNAAYMALGRINYESKKFDDSFRYYRMVEKDSYYYYDSLFEQSWAFFLGGYPNHALGALYSIETPFFEDRFNPEASILKSMIYYWMCRYDDAKIALHEFNTKHSEGVKQINAFLNRKRIDAGYSYQLFEDLISGVTSESLNMPRNLLETAAEKENMILLRNQFAAFLTERRQIVGQGIFGSRQNVGKAISYLDALISSTQVDIGNQFMAQLAAFKESYQMLDEQAEFLYVELLMSEREQILGNELHANSKFAEISEEELIKGWGKDQQKWNQDKDEYWWDELGNFIFKTQPMCRIK